MQPGVLIVDDHATFRVQARRLVESVGWTVSGEAVSGREAIEAVERLRPWLVLIDVQLPDVNGFDLAEALGRGGRGPRVVMTSAREAAFYARRLRRPDAPPFIHKPALSRAALAGVAESRV